MTRHYKALGIWMVIIALVAVAAVLIRSFLPTPPLEYHQEVEKYAEQFGLEPALVFAVIKTESDFDPEARSHKDAYGLMQITESTLNWAMFREGKNADHTVEDLYDPAVNVKYGCLILSLLLEEFQDTDTALAAYNAGRGNALKWLKDSRYSDDGIHLKDTPYDETDGYIKKVNKYYQKYLKTLGENP